MKVVSIASDPNMVGAASPNRPQCGGSRVGRTRPPHAVPVKSGVSTDQPGVARAVGPNAGDWVAVIRTPLAGEVFRPLGSVPMEEGTHPSSNPNLPPSRATLFH